MSAINTESIDIRFDNDRKLRVLSQKDYEHYKETANECDSFISSKLK